MADLADFSLTDLTFEVDSRIERSGVPNVPRVFPAGCGFSSPWAMPTPIIELVGLVVQDPRFGNDAIVFDVCCDGSWELGFGLPVPAGQTLNRWISVRYEIGKPLVESPFDAFDDCSYDYQPFTTLDAAYDRFMKHTRNRRPPEQ
jgi:hypothetical protein